MTKNIQKTENNKSLKRIFKVISLVIIVPLFLVGLWIFATASFLSGSTRGLVFAGFSILAVIVMVIISFIILRKI